jgi:hypothetical protein
LQRILADLIEKPDRLGVGLKHIDRFVQIEDAFREQDRACLSACSENISGVKRKSCLRRCRPRGRGHEAISAAAAWTRAD